MENWKARVIKSVLRLSSFVTLCKSLNLFDLKYFSWVTRLALIASKVTPALTFQDAVMLLYPYSLR